MVKNNSFKTLLLKIIASLVLLMPVGLCTFLIQELYYYFTSIFYVMLYFVIAVYYLYLMWWKKEFSGENLLLLPLWKKIGLYRKETDLFKLRKKLIWNVAPLIVGTIFLSIVVAGLGHLGERDDNGYYSESDITFGSVILIIPIIAWIIFFIKEYGKEWIKSSNNKDKIDMHIFSALQRLKETGSMEPTQRENIFDKLPKFVAPKWEIKNERPFTQEEIDAIDTAIVVASNNGRSVQFTMKSGGMTFIPLDNSSNLNACELIDITKATLITLGKQGEGDIYRVKD
jgi:hypothetical protein